MSRDRFLQLFQNLHLCNPVSSSGSPRNNKIQPFLDLLGPRFETAFKPGKCIAVNDAMISFRGRDSFRQYIRGKSHPFGIKAFVLVDSKTGYMCKLRIYFGTETDLISDHTFLQTTCVVLTLSHSYEGLGHHIFTNCFYMTPELAMELERCGLAFTETAQTNRRGMPQAIKCSGKRSVARGSVRVYHVGKAMALQWQDKYNFTILSTTGTCNMVKLQTCRGSQKKSQRWSSYTIKICLEWTRWTNWPHTIPSCASQ